MKFLAPIVAAFAALALFIPLSGSASAQVGTCTGGLATVCGPYVYSGITPWSNGYTTYVTDQDVGCGGDATLCNDNLNATDPGNWSATEDINTPASYCQQVRTAPMTDQQTYPPGGTGPINLSDYKALYSTFSVTNPASSWSGETAYDVWSTNETMIWLDDHNHAHGEIYQGTMKIYGQAFRVYTDGPTSNPGEIVVELASPHETSGTVHIKAILNWLAKRGWEAPDPQIGLIVFGWEVCGTGGQPETFTVNSYSLTGVPN